MKKSSKPASGPVLVVTIGETLPREARDDPEAALRQARADAAAMAELMAYPAMRAMDKKSTLGGVGMWAAAFDRRVELLQAGRDEARKLAAMLDEAASGGLRKHLQAEPPSPECVLWLLHENRRLCASQAASKAAQQKNAAARAFVMQAWRKQTDKGQSKASFARMIAPELRRRFAVAVTPERIAKYWLPKR